MRRVDLDDLRAKADACGGSATARVLSKPYRIAPPYAESLFDVLTEQGGCEVYERCTRKDAEFAVASQPAVVIALLDRIAELERGYGALIEECEERTENPGGDFYAGDRETLEKGAVIP